MLAFAWPADHDAILRGADGAGWLPGRIARESSPTPERDIRRCNVSHGIPAEVAGALLAFVTKTGRAAFGFELDGARDYDPLYVMRYETGDHFTWHVDNGIDGPPMGTRKLSFTLQLSPAESYDGGDLEFATYAQAYNEEIPGPSPVLRQRGTLVLFPSFMLHRVSPVTRGVRYALVGWVHGPAFR